MSPCDPCAQPVTAKVSWESRRATTGKRGEGTTTTESVLDACCRMMDSC
jgi:hypothetical protein